MQNLQAHNKTIVSTPSPLQVVHSKINGAEQTAPAKKKKIRVLSIDGGGIRGIIPATILAYVEKELQKRTNNPDARLSDYFDFFAGTSTGGILTCIYLTPDENKRPAMTAEEGLRLYLDHGRDIFNASLSRKFLTAGGLADEIYKAEFLEKKLQEQLGENTLLSQTLKPCMLTSYDIEKRRAMFLTSEKAKRDGCFDFNLWEAARATSAAPVYFEPVKIRPQKGRKSYVLVDGGLFANNPSLCAYSEVRRMAFASDLGLSGKADCPSAKDMMIVSIGTGSSEKPYLYRKMKDRGALGWAMPVMDMLMSGNAETVNHQLKMMYKTIKDEADRNFYRIEPSSGTASSGMDDVCPDNLQALYNAGEDHVERYQDQLDSIIGKLIENH